MAFIVEIDGVDRGPAGTGIVRALACEVAGKNKIGTATLELSFPSSGGYTFLNTREVRIYETTGVVANVLFGGFIANYTSRTFKGTNRKTVTLRCKDYNWLLDTVIRDAQDAKELTVTAGTMLAQLEQIVQAMQENGGGSVNREIEVGDYISTLTGATVLPAFSGKGQSLRWFIQQVMDHVHAEDDTMRPRFHINLLPDGSASGVQVSLVVYDAANKSAAVATFSQSPAGAEKGIIDFERTLDASMPLANRGQSVWQQGATLIRTYEGTASVVDYYNRYINHGIDPGSGALSVNAGYWMYPVIQDTESTTSAEAQLLIDRTIQAREFPRETIKLTWDKTPADSTFIRPGQVVAVVWDDEGLSDDYEVSGVAVEFPLTKNPSYQRFTYTLGLPKLALFEDGSDGITGAPTVHDINPPNAPTSLTASSTYDILTNQSRIILTWVQSTSTDAAYNVVYRRVHGSDFERIPLDGLYTTYTYWQPAGSAYGAYVTAVDGSENESEPSNAVSGTSAQAYSGKVKNDSYEELDPSDSTLPRYHTRNLTAGGTAVSSTAEHSHGIRSAKLSTAGGGTDRAGLITDFFHVRSVTGKKSAVTWDAKASHASTTMKFAIGGYDAAFAFLGAVTVSKTVGTAFSSESTTIPATIGGSPVIYARLEPFNDNTSARDIYVDNIRVIQQSVPDVIEDDAIDGDKINPVVTLTDQTITLTSTSKILAGGGKVTVDVDGIKVGNSSGSNNIDFYNDVGTRIGRMYAGGASGDGVLTIEADYNGAGTTLLGISAQDGVDLSVDAFSEQIVMNNEGLLFDSGATTRPHLFQGGSVVAGLPGVSTSATDGFLYIASSAGVPVGTPTTIGGGTTNALNWDRTNHNLYIYSGGSWRLISTGGTITGTGANTRLAIWTGTSTQSSDTGLTFNTTTDALTVGGGANFGGDMAVDASGGSSGSPRIMGLTNLGYARIQVGDAFTSMQSNNGGRFVFQAYHGMSFWGARGTTGSVQGFESGGGGGDPSVRVYSSQGGTKTFAVQIASGQSANAIEVEPNGGGTALFAVQADGDIEMAGLKVLGDRITGWGAPTGTPTRTTFATGSVTLPQLAERVKALIDDLTTHGMIGA